MVWSVWHPLVSDDTLTYVYRLSDLVPSPNNRSPLTAIVFFADFLPVMLFYYFTAVMVLIPKTFHLRLAFLPITLWSAFRAATSIDIALAFHQPSLAYLNYGLCVRNPSSYPYDNTDCSHS